MPDPAVLYCVGATKAGTSWVYRYLRDHPDCALPAVKEAHYWDTFEPDDCDRQLSAYRERLGEMHDLKAAAQDADRGWQIRNLDRRIAEMDALLAVLAGDRQNDAAYLGWLTKNRGASGLFADVTPSYATLPDATLDRMMRLTPKTKFIYLMRDPLDRLWSHVRMLARRQLHGGADFARKANRLLARTLERGPHTPTFARGDYKTNVAKLWRVVPADRLLVQFFEDIFTPAGIARLCAFLGIEPLAKAQDRVVHAGQKAVMDDALRPKALQMLNEQYDWVARNVGPLPQRWQENQARMTA